MNANDLVFSTNENNIMSAGFNINSLLLKEQINVNLENYMIPIGLSCKEKEKEKENINDTYSSKVIDSDLYDRLVEYATQPLNKRKSQKSKPKKNNKTKKGH
jgi:hypothetical protein